ncbi:MAG: NAD(P)H-dependent oxidoreductase [Pseudomonadota bacterium]
MNLLAFSGSNSRQSINRALVDYAVTRLRDEILPAISVTTLDLNDYEMPIYSIDREKASGIPEPAQRFFDAIGAADGVLVSFAEHNGFVTAAWKNIFDWMSRIDGKVWQDKPLAMLAATPGGRAGANVLASQETLAPFFGATLKGTYGVGRWFDAWDKDQNRLVRSEDIEGVDHVLRNLVGAVEG